MGNNNFEPLLDRSLSSPKFESWRLSFSLVDLAEAKSVRLPSKVALTAGSATDYIRTRLAALHNSLHCSNGTLYVFLLQGSDLTLNQISLNAGSISLSPLAILVQPDAAALQHGGLLHAPLSCSCCEVTQSSGVPKLLALSSGHGDLTVGIHGGGLKGWCLSNTVCPVTAGAPVGVEPFVIQAAVRTSQDTIRVAVITIMDKTESWEAGCEVRLCELRVAADTTTISVASTAAVVYVSSLPPFAVVMDAAAGYPEGSLLIAAAPGHPKQEGREGDHPDHRGLGLPQGGSTAGPTAAAAAGQDSDDDIDPELLAAAQARLAHMTSDTPQEEVLDLHSADVFKEGGPEGLGELGSEPPCHLLLFKLEPVGGFQAVCSRSLSPYNLLTSQSGLSGLGQPAALLGVTDDVDCAVMRVSVGPASSSEQIQIKHEGTVPALAYIAAGKQQKKFLLLPPSSDLSSPGCAVSAVLVESQKYVYVYGRTAPNSIQGSQQVVDLQSQDYQGIGSPVEGARLIRSGDRQVVVLLTEIELLLLPLVAQ
mmetsp:Transcript_37750/g.106682  ORF Transcript_37750/g.106682 Transcript_37750/m.106682 type:complete len:536 (-) Transcript_37750:283-1890(-)